MMNTIPLTSFAIIPINVSKISELVASLFGAAIDLLSSIGLMASDILNTDGTTFISEIDNLLSKAIEAFMPSLQGIGYGIAIMFFLFNFLNMVTTDNLTLEQFIKKFCWLFVGIAMVSLAPTFFNKIIQFGDAFTKMVAKNTFLHPGDGVNIKQIDALLVDTLPEKVDDSLLFMYMGLMVVCIIIPLIIMIGSAIIYGVIYVIAFTRILEINVRGAFLPIGLSLFSDECWRGAGGRYLRKFLAIACQGAGIAMIGQVMSSAISLAFSYSISAIEPPDTLLDEATLFLEMTVELLKAGTISLAIAAACVMAMFKAQQIISDVFGAQ